MAGSNVTVQNINGSGSIKNYGTMRINNFGIGTDTVYNYGTLIICNANNGVLVNFGTCTYEATSLNSSVSIVNQSSGTLTLTSPSIYLNNFFCNAGLLYFTNITLNNMGTLCNCGTSTGSVSLNNGAGYYTETSCGPCDFYTPLPVKLSYFKFNQENNHVHLLWQTLSEVNADYFKIYKSYDAANWEVVDRVNANGNSNSILNYELDVPNDNHLVYYNLKQVDFDGFENDYGIIGVSSVYNKYTLMSDGVISNDPANIHLYSLSGVEVKSCLNCTNLNWNVVPSSIYILKINNTFKKVFKP